MAHGGSRHGAGRKPGAVIKRTREIAEAIIQDGNLTPLEFLTQVYRDVTEEMSRRVDAAKAAAPYVHARLQPVDDKGDSTLKIASGPGILNCPEE